jgi:hypothetical protein
LPRPTGIWRSPFYSDTLFRGERDQHPSALVLDVQNALAHLARQRALDDLVKLEFKTFKWDEGDPLADAFLITLGFYRAPTSARSITTRLSLAL